MIYPLDKQIEFFLDTLYNPETGELLDGVTEENIEKQLEQLAIDFDVKIDSLASEIKNLKAEAADIKEEKMKLEKRQSQVENRLERTKRFLAYLLHGNKWKNGKHSVSYLTSKETVIDNQEDFVKWANVNFPSLLKYKAPEPIRSEIKKAINDGLDVSFAHLEPKRNIQIR